MYGVRVKKDHETVLSVLLENDMVATHPLIDLSYGNPEWNTCAASCVYIEMRLRRPAVKNPLSQR